MDSSSSPLSRSAIKLISLYQKYISAGRPSRCKYYPSCSQYTLIAIKRFGFFRGILLGGWRLLHYQPWSYGGVDDVPHKFSLFYRQKWSKAHEEITTKPIIAMEEGNLFEDRESDHKCSDHKDEDKNMIGECGSDK